MCNIALILFEEHNSESIPFDSRKAKVKLIASYTSINIVLGVTHPFIYDHIHITYA